MIEPDEEDISDDCYYCGLPLIDCVCDDIADEAEPEQ